MFHLIDADILVLNVTSEIIASEGFETLSFESPLAYIEYVNSPAFAPPMAMITCYNLPGMNGYELVEEVRKTCPRMRAMIISGSAGDNFNPQLEHVVCRKLAKPYQAKELFSALTALKLCNETIKDINCNTFSELCKFGMNHECPLYAAT